jgi:hypothetical protein
VAELGALRSVSHPHLVQYLGCGINSEKQPDGTAPKRYLAIVRPQSPCLLSCAEISYATISLAWKHVPQLSLSGSGWHL